MPYEKIEAPFEGTDDKIRLLKLAFGRTWYAVGPCDVYLGLTKLNAGDKAIAVMYHDGAAQKLEKHINLRHYATKWLTDRWLNPTAAELLIDLSLELCKPDDVGPVERQVVDGDYFETMEKMADELVAGIKEGSIRDRRTLRERIVFCVEQSIYCTDYQMALVSLRCCEGRPVGQVQRLAKTAMYDGVAKLVFKTGEFSRLPKKATA